MSGKKFNIKDIIKPSQKDKSEKDSKAVVKEATSKREAVRQKLQDAKASVVNVIEEIKPTKTHVVKAGETLSHIALNYYGKATPPYYQLIYQHNRDVIGDNINIIVPGQKLVIPDLPEELK